MATIQSPEVKEAIKQNIKLSLESAESRANRFRQSKKELEKVHRKFFEEIQKKSDYFVLEEKDCKEYFAATMYQITDEGVTNYSNLITIHNVLVEYKEYVIKLKPGVCKAPVHIFIEEDVKYTRRGRAYTNNGWKIQARIRYNDSNKYKTGGSIVKLINEQIEQEENQRKHDEMVNSRRKKVKDALSERFRFCSYEVISDGKEYSVEIKHGIKLVVLTRINEIGDVEITPKRTEFTGKSLGIVLKGLESM